MGDDPSRMRLDIWCEDQLQGVFVRGLLTRMGFDRRRLEFHIAPAAAGSAERWVLEQYPHAVSRLRSKRYQRSLGLVVMRDGDRDGVDARKAQMDARLLADSMPGRSIDERIALPFPQWSIESWLLVLLGADAEESGRDKHRLQQVESDVAGAARRAARSWASHPTPTPSMAAARAELGRL